VDWVRCDGHGLCAHLVPELVHLDKTGFPVILPIPVPPWLAKNVQHAVQMCPALALRVDTDPKKSGAGKGGPVPPPIPVAAPVARTGLLGGGRKSISAG
jgi:ferredoxin